MELVQVLISSVISWCLTETLRKNITSCSVCLQTDAFNDPFYNQDWYKLNPERQTLMNRGRDRSDGLVILMMKSVRCSEDVSRWICIALHTFIYQNGPLYRLTFDPAVFAAWERVTLAGHVTFDLPNTDGFSCGLAWSGRSVKSSVLDIETHSSLSLSLCICLYGWFGVSFYSWSSVMGRDTLTFLWVKINIQWDFLFDQDLIG